MISAREATNGGEHTASCHGRSIGLLDTDGEVIDSTISFEMIPFRLPGRNDVVVWLSFVGTIFLLLGCRILNTTREYESV